MKNPRTPTPAAPRARAPHPSPLLLFSALLHGGGAAALALASGYWRSILLALFADHVLLATAGMLPRCRLLGPNLRDFHDATRSSAATAPTASGRCSGKVALTFDDGPDPLVTPRVLEILSRRDHRATFFVIGRRGAEHPELLSEIVSAGHTLGNHTWSHPSGFAMLPPRSLARELDRTQSLIEQVSETRPCLFRAPAGVRSPLLELLLARRELHLTSWTRRGFDAVATDARVIQRRLVNGLSAGDILLLHDGQTSRWQRRRLATGDGPVVLEVLPELLDRLEAEGLQSGALGRDIPIATLLD